MRRNDGGPAFPQPLGSETVAGCEGLSLRDFFAAKAMQAILSRYPGAEYLDGEYSTVAYDVADSMLKARGEA